MNQIDYMFSVLLKVFITVFLCGALGFERELRNKVAGMRTHILVGLGSTLIVLTSMHVSDIYKSTIPADPTRMIAGIVTGIGFLCAGTIIRGGAHVSGLTTAATLWIVSGIGTAVGAGDYIDAIIVTLVVYIVLVWVRALEQKIQQITNHK